MLKIENVEVLGWEHAIRGMRNHLETIFQMNIDKLRARYPDGFDADHSLHRRANDI